MTAYKLHRERLLVTTPKEQVRDKLKDEQNRKFSLLYEYYMKASTSRTASSRPTRPTCSRGRRILDADRLLNHTPTSWPRWQARTRTLRRAVARGWPS